MLEKLDLTKSMNKEEYKAKMAELMPKIGKLQRECRELKIPVMITFEGYGASGKGAQIAQLIKALDPRGFEVHAVKTETEEEKMHPFLWRFWMKMPAKGKIAIYDSSWYRKVLIERFDKKMKKEEIEASFDSICSFEEQLTSDGMILIKIFLAIDQKEQKKRFEKLLSSEETAWRVSKGDRKRNKEFERYQEINEEMLRRTNTDYAPWNIVEAVDRRYATARIYSIVEKILSEKIKEKQNKLNEKEVVLLKNAGV
ncbi:MAG: polyphosphate kinase 2 family protein, partial [Lachnospiraceae bacterium]